MVTRFGAVPSALTIQMSSLLDPRYPRRYHVPGPRTNATASPVGAKWASFASNRFNLRSVPPAAGTTKHSALDGYAVERGDENTTPLPSGVQPLTMSGAWSKVSRFGFPPTAGTTNTSYCPNRLELNAMCRPSGLNTGFTSCASCMVTGRATPPIASTVQMSPR